MQFVGYRLIDRKVYIELEPSQTGPKQIANLQIFEALHHANGLGGPMGAWPADAISMSHDGKRFEIAPYPLGNNSIEQRDYPHLKMSLQMAVASIGDSINIQCTLSNSSNTAHDISFGSPCLALHEASRFRSDKKNLNEGFAPRCFIRTGNKFVFLNAIPRTPGKSGADEYQWYAPPGVEDLVKDHVWGVAKTKATEGLIGVVSLDTKHILAFAWSHWHSLAQGFFSCIHCQPSFVFVPPQTKIDVVGKIYFIPNNMDLLWSKFESDFGKTTPFVP